MILITRYMMTVGGQRRIFCIFSHRYDDEIPGVLLMKNTRELLQRDVTPLTLSLQYFLWIIRCACDSESLNLQKFSMNSNWLHRGTRCSRSMWRSNLGAVQPPTNI